MYFSLWVLVLNVWMSTHAEEPTVLRGPTISNCECAIHHDI